MTTSQDESTLSQGLEKKMSLNDHDPRPKGDDDGVVLTTAGSLSSPLVCTAESCSLPLQGDSQLVEKSEKSDEQKQSEESSETNADNNNKTHHHHKNKNHRKKKKGGGSGSSSIQQVHTQSDLNKILEQNDTVLLEFVTTWCTACHGIQPLYEELAQTAITNSGDDAAIKATQVVCDKNKETKKLADANGVGSYPVFILFENGREVNKWKGADVGKLEKVFDNYGGGGGFGGKKGKGGKGKKGRR